MELEHPVELLEPLSFILGRLLNDICERLAFRALAANELHLRLVLENAPDHKTTLKLPVPMLDTRAFLKMLQLELSGKPPVAAVLKVALRAEPAKPRRTQHGLFVPSSPEPEKLELTVARVRHLVGDDKVGSPRMQDTHRPDRFEMLSFAPPVAKDGNPAFLERKKEFDPAAPLLCLRRFRPPRFSQVLVVNREPVRISSPTVNGRIVVAKGPWRTSGEWWQEDAWNREEWDVALESGELYRLSQEIDSGRWFIEGSLD